jgi:polyvinyl alcohol dehydrogenase (cytochrome)
MRGTRTGSRRGRQAQGLRAAAGAAGAVAGLCVAAGLCAAALCVAAAASADPVQPPAATQPPFETPPESNSCANPPGPVSVGTAQWSGWGRDPENSRYQPEPALRAADVPKLALKWAYGYRSKAAYGQPTVVDGRLFVTNSAGRIYSLDAGTGCTYWTFDASAGVRTAISVGQLAPARPPHMPKAPRRRHVHIDAHVEVDKPPAAVFFGDDGGAVYALDAQRGTLLWKTQADTNPAARITGAPTLFRDRLYVPVSSAQTPAGTTAGGGFRGSVVAIGITNGRILWKTYTVQAAGGDQAAGAAGIAVGSAPTVDPARGVLYVATGDSYSDPAQPMHDALVALDLDDGKPRWVKQVAPQHHHPLKADADFRASPILRSLPSGKQILLLTERSGVVYGLDPDRGGEIFWQTPVQPDGVHASTEWGAAADHRNIYIATGDPEAGIDNPAATVAADANGAAVAAQAPAGTGAGPVAALTAINIATGRPRWSTPAPTPPCSWKAGPCSHSQSQAVTVIPGAAFSGSIDGHLRAYSTIDGKIIWDFDTAREYRTVNGVVAHGGSLDHGGATVVDGVVYVNSGYGAGGGFAGNVLLAFSVDGK